jgi:RNA polymerase sigma-70 factor (ECF subfamily)
MAEDSHLRTRATLLGRLGRNPADAAAWDQFVQRYGPKIYEWCRRWRLQDADAQDVAQEVLVQVARKMRTFAYDPARSFRGWLKKITHDAWCQWQRDRARRPEAAAAGRGLEALAAAEARDDLERRLLEQFDAELLEEASARVRERVAAKTWEAFRLVAFDQLSGAEAAARLGIKVGAVYVARARVGKLLQDTLRELDPPEEGPGQPP